MRLETGYIARTRDNRKLLVYKYLELFYDIVEHEFIPFSDEQDNIVEVYKYSGIEYDSKEVVWTKSVDVDWSTVAVDTPIWVTDGGAPWCPRYFARYDDGVVYAWTNGTTSHTANGLTIDWKYAKLRDEN